MWTRGHLCSRPHPPQSHWPAECSVSYQQPTSCSFKWPHSLLGSKTAVMPQRFSVKEIAVCLIASFKKSRGWWLYFSCRQIAHFHTSIQGTKKSLFICSTCRELCSRRDLAALSLCSQQAEDREQLFVVEPGQKRMAVFACLENQGENAYRTAIHISTSANLLFSSLLVKVLRCSLA